MDDVEEVVVDVEPSEVLDAPGVLTVVVACASDWCASYRTSPPTATPLIAASPVVAVANRRAPRARKLCGLLAARELPVGVVMRPVGRAYLSALLALPGRRL